MRNRKLTEKQIDAYEFIVRYIQEKSYPPTNREIAKGLGISLEPAQKRLNALYLKGWIKKMPNCPRGIILL